MLALQIDRFHLVLGRATMNVENVSARGRVPFLVAAYVVAGKETKIVMERREERGDHLIAQSQGLRHAVPTAVPSVASLRLVDIYA